MGKENQQLCLLVGPLLHPSSFHSVCISSFVNHEIDMKCHLFAGITLSFAWFTTDQLFRYVALRCCFCFHERKKDEDDLDVYVHVYYCYSLYVRACAKFEEERSFLGDVRLLQSWYKDSKSSYTSPLRVVSPSHNSFRMFVLSWIITTHLL